MFKALPYHLRFGCGFGSKAKIIVILVVGKPFQLGIFPRTLMRTANRVIEIICKGAVINVEGVKFGIRDMASYYVCLPIHEPWMWNYLKPKEGDIFLDVGAHIGRYALLVAKMVGDSGKVLAIEPDPINFSILRENIELNKFHNVIALNIAAWSNETKLEFFLGEGSAHGSVKKTYADKLHGPRHGYMKVSARPLDTVISEIGLGEISYIKIDVEGAEFEALKGLEQTLKKNSPRLIVEVLEENIDKVKEYVSGLGYETEVIWEGYHVDPPHVYMMFEKRPNKKIER